VSVRRPYWIWYRAYRSIDHYTIAVPAQHGYMYEVSGKLGHVWFRAEGSGLTIVRPNEEMNCIEHLETPSSTFHVWN
jgi:hypothetical protein